MKKKAIEIINKVLALKQQYDDMPKPEPATITLTTGDGIQVSVDKLEVGGKATINGVPAAANTYSFTDGSSITTDASGVITAVTTSAAPSAQEENPTPTPAPTPAPIPAPQPQAMEAQEPEKKTLLVPTKIVFSDESKTPEGIDKLFAAFATGSAEERIANLEVVAKALMEYSFGWEIKQAKEKSDRDAAIKVYTDQLAPLQTQMESQKKTIEGQKLILDQVFELVQDYFKSPVADPPQPTKTQGFSFNGNPKPKKGVLRYAEAARKIQEQREAEAAK